MACGGLRSGGSGTKSQGGESLHSGISGRLQVLYVLYAFAGSFRIPSSGVTVLGFYHFGDNEVLENIRGGNAHGGGNRSSAYIEDLSRGDHVRAVGEGGVCRP